MERAYHAAMFHGKHQLTIWLSEDEVKALDGHAKRMAVPRATAIRRLIRPDPNPPEVTVTKSRKEAPVPSSFPKAEAVIEGLPCSGCGATERDAAGRVVHVLVNGPGGWKSCPEMGK